MLTLKIVPRVLSVEAENRTTIEMGLYLVDDKGVVRQDIGKHIIVTHNDGSLEGGSLDLSNWDQLAAQCRDAVKRMRGPLRLTGGKNGKPQAVN